MSTFLTALSTIVLPILLVAGIGFALCRSGLITDSRPLARAALYFFVPALVLNGIAESKLSSGDFFSLLLFSVAVACALGVLSYLVARMLNLDRLLTSAFLLSAIFMNAGNIGLPFNQFAFGQPGLARASVYFVGSSILAQTAAIFIASRGRTGWRDSLIAVFKMPLVYAAVIGLIMNRMEWELPVPLARALDISAGAAVPVMLVMLGLELGRLRFDGQFLPVVLATALKLLAAPIVALLIAELMQLRDLTRAVAVLEASMPTAVNASLIAVEFDSRPDFVTSVVFTSTVASMVTLVLLLLLLGYPG